MNPLLSRLQPYPFERLRHLFSEISPNPDYTPVSLGIGEPRHATPELIIQALRTHTSELAAYPATAGLPAFRQACADWVKRRYEVFVNPTTQILPVNGSREALFAFAQTVLDARDDSVVVSPNPFYQIYEGAAFLGNASVHYAPSLAAKNFAVDWDSVPVDVWKKTRLLFVCSPGNPTGAVMPLDEWQKLFALSDEYGFVIASGRVASGGFVRAFRFQTVGVLHQPVQTQQCAGTAQRFCRRGCRVDRAFFALPHLPRQRHGRHGATGQHRGLE